MYAGFVRNFTLSSDPCHQPDLQGIEGFFIQPWETDVTDHLIPMFSGSKMSFNNDILIPAAMSWKPIDIFDGGAGSSTAWTKKKDRAIWRGTASGGFNTPENWRGFHRHRFVAMNNATTLANLQASGDVPQNFAWPEGKYRLQSHAKGRLAAWVGEWSDIGITTLSCSEPQADGTCEYTSPFFREVKSKSLSEQFRQCKYMPDIDGNGYSGRFLSFLRSTSLPIKATLWREWQDSRLLAWRHFVPMDNRFTDYFGIMEYFLGYEGEGGHDEAAKTIALEGKNWAEKVLRKEDMQIYTLRLLLEYGRVLADHREHMGWTDDVQASDGVAVDARSP